MRREFENCNVLIYNDKGDLLANVKILDYDWREKSIVVKNIPILANVRHCDLLILSSPAPFSYKGTMYQNYDGNKAIKIYQEKEQENRKEMRYKVNLPASIRNFIYDGKDYPLSTPLDVEIVNISKSGMRFRSKPNAFEKGNKFHISMKLGDNEKTLTAEIVNHLNISADLTEFGCRLVELGVK